MIIVAQGSELRKGEIIIFTGYDEIPCPVCSGKLKVHGTCRRKFIRRGGAQVYRLRVMECRECGRTHRELPDFAVPYKRMDVEMLSEVAEDEGHGRMAKSESSTRHRVRTWVLWFLRYARNVQSGLCISMPDLPTIPDGGPLRRRLAYFVRLVVNSGNWVQHRSAVTARGGPAILGAS